MSIYLLYGVRHSAERMRQQSNGDYIPLGQVSTTDEMGPGNETKNPSQDSKTSDN